MLESLSLISLLAAFGFLTLMVILRHEISARMRRTVRVPVPVLTNEGERRLRAEQQRHAQAESQE